MTATVDPTEGVYRRCQICGFKYRHEELRKNWKGQVVCKHDYEPRHPTELYQGRVPRRRDTNLGSGDGYGIIDATKSALKFTAINNLNAGNSYITVRISTTPYVIQSGDTLQYDYYLEQFPAVNSKLGGMRIGYSDGSFIAPSDNDTDDGLRNWISGGVNVGPSSVSRAQGWYHRKLAPFAVNEVGKTVNSWELYCDGDEVGTYIAWYKNILIRDANGNLAAIGWISGDPSVNTVIAQTNYTGPNTVVATTPIM